MNGPRDRAGEAATTLVALVSAGLKETPTRALVVDDDSLGRGRAAAELVPSEQRRGVAVEVLALAVKVKRVTEGTGVDAGPALRAIVQLVELLVDDATAIDVFAAAGFSNEAGRLLGRSVPVRAPPAASSSAINAPSTKPRRGLTK